MTLILPESMKYLHLPQHEGVPRQDNGEDLIESVLTNLNIWHEYETIIYLFRSADGGVQPGFRPDFPLFREYGVPACNLEVTWPDHPKQSNWSQSRRCKDTITIKRKKILTTWELYNIPTLLLNFAATMAIHQNPHILLGLLNTINDEEGAQGCYYPTGDDLKSRRKWRK